MSRTAKQDFDCWRQLSIDERDHVLASLADQAWEMRDGPLEEVYKAALAVLQRASAPLAVKAPRKKK